MSREAEAKSYAIKVPGIKEDQYVHTSKKRADNIQKGVRAVFNAIKNLDSWERTMVLHYAGDASDVIGDQKVR